MPPGGVEEWRPVTAKTLDGRALARRIRERLTEQVRDLATAGVVPGLGTVLVGDDPGSRSYVAGKHRDCARLGIASQEVELPADSSQACVEDAVAALNADPACTGFLVQAPLPPHLDAFRVLDLVDPTKDVDGLHPANLGRLTLGEPGPKPCTARGVLALLRAHEIDLHGTDICVVGRGSHTRAADIVIVAAGSAHLLRPDMVKPGAAVVDIGLTRTDAGLVGDVDPGVAEVAGWLSPNPGGIGLMTRAMLMANVVEAAGAPALEG